MKYGWQLFWKCQISESMTPICLLRYYNIMSKLLAIQTILFLIWISALSEHLQEKDFMSIVLNF